MSWEDYIRPKIDLLSKLCQWQTNRDREKEISKFIEERK